MNLLIFLFGLLIGSFLNCLIWRLHTRQSLGGRSQCPSCKKMITWYDNIPLLSFIFLRGSCRHCKTNISWRYPLVEAITALLFVLAFVRLINIFGPIEVWAIPTWLILARDLLFISSLIVVFVTDVVWYVIYDEVVLPTAFLILVLNLFLGVSWLNLLLSATIGSGFFLFQFLISKGRWIGGGDIRLGLLLGVAFGLPLLIPAIFIAYILGAVIGVGLLLLQRRQWKSALPLGSFLAISALITLFYGQALIDWYLQFVYFR